MTNKTAAARYAKAVFDVAVKEQADLDAVEHQLAAFADLFTQHPTLEKVLLNPAVPVPRKRAVVALLVERAGLPGIVSKLLGLLADRDRLVLLPDVLAAYRDRLLDHQHVVRAEVQTATALTPDREKTIEESLARISGRRVRLSTSVDPAMIGGFVARVGSTIYDGSVTTQLKRMKQRLSENA